MIYANEATEITDSAEIFNNSDVDEEIIKDIDEEKTDSIDSLFTPSTLFPSTSTTMMADAISSEESAEEQLDSIKEVAEKITLAIKSEMANLLTYALTTSDKEEEESNLRKKRSVESPIDSSQLVMQLLKHIKSNNEFQNIAIDKMMTAQEIADKFGIEFNPDPEILTDLAVAANEQAQELSSMLNEVCDLKNNTNQRLTIVPLEGEENIDILSENNTFFVYAIYYPDDDTSFKSSVPSHECMPETVTHSHYYYNYPYDSHISTTSGNHQHSHTVSQKSNFYDAVSYTPERYSSYRSIEPTSSFVSPIETLEPEPDLVAEEYEETMSNKVVVERGDEPGAATVNHVTTYSISEKSHFKNPQIERLPQQMQYSFYLI